MVDYNLDIKNNPLKTKADVQKAFLQLTDPLIQHYSPGCAQLKIGNTGARFSENFAFMEGFSRILWGLAPFLCGQSNQQLEVIYLKGLANGTDPSHEEYWGDILSSDQRIVEMAAMGLALALCPEKLWEPLTELQKDNLSSWLGFVNQCEIFQNNNWLFFRAMVDIGLDNVGRSYDRQLLNETLDKIDAFYVGDGWYTDGKSRQLDYYIPFGMHFYGLLYGKYANAPKYLERAELFAKDFIYWFARQGDALPYGRSLTYKFAQTAFWCAYIFAGGKEMDIGVVKGIIMRNLRWWFSQPVFDRDGILTIGYRYPNLIMSEDYNSPGSQYWALKSFLILALPDDHAFWLAEEKPLPRLPENAVLKHPMMLIQHMEDNMHVVALASGQYAGFKPVHTDAKYAKFAYSNAFGFSVARSYYDPKQGAFDSMLALSDDGRNYRVRTTCERVGITQDRIISVWKPWDDVEIETTLIPANPYHIRIHKIKSARKLITAECGFAVARDEGATVCEILSAPHSVCTVYPWGSSGIMDLTGERKAEFQITEANTNLLHPRTVMPMLTGSIQAGETTLVCAVLGGIGQDYCKKAWQMPPEVTINNKIILNGRILL